MRFSHRTLVAVTILAFAQGCGMSTAKPHAETAVAEFHRQMNEADYHAIWNGADDEFKSGSQRAQYDKLMLAIQHKLGQVVKSTTVGWQVRTHNLKTLTVLSQDTQFEHGKGRETFTFVERDGRAILLGYYIDSMDMMTQ